jgi:hypothetical protein
MHDAVKIGAGRLELVFTAVITAATAPASTLQLAHGLPRQILGKDCFFLVRFIARRSGLKVEAESAG